MVLFARVFELFQCFDVGPDSGHPGTELIRLSQVHLETAVPAPIVREECFEPSRCAQIDPVDRALDLHDRSFYSIPRAMRAARMRVRRGMARAECPAGVSSAWSAPSGSSSGVLTGSVLSGSVSDSSSEEVETPPS